MNKYVLVTPEIWAGGFLPWSRRLNPPSFRPLVQPASPPLNSPDFFRTRDSSSHVALPSYPLKEQSRSPFKRRATALGRLPPFPPKFLDRNLFLVLELLHVACAGDEVSVREEGAAAGTGAWEMVRHVAAFQSAAQSGPTLATVTTSVCGRFGKLVSWKTGTVYQLFL